MGISDQYCPCGVPLWEGEDYCRNCGQENEWDPACPNCGEKLNDPDICDFCRWEPDDDLAAHRPEPALGAKPPLGEGTPNPSGHAQGTPSRQGKPWLSEEETELRHLFESGKSVDEISKILGRTPGAIKSRLQRLGLNQSVNANSGAWSDVVGCGGFLLVVLVLLAPLALLGWLISSCEGDSEESSEQVASGSGLPTTVEATFPELSIAEREILTAPYSWGPGGAVRELQEVLGVTVDGWYGPRTHQAHVTELDLFDLSTANSPQLLDGLISFIRGPGNYCPKGSSGRWGNCHVTGEGYLMVVDPNGGSPNRIGATSQARYPHWYRDGDVIAYEVEQSFCDLAHNCGLWSLDTTELDEQLRELAALNAAKDAASVWNVGSHISKVMEAERKLEELEVVYLPFEDTDRSGNHLNENDMHFDAFLTGISPDGEHVLIYKQIAPSSETSETQVCVRKIHFFGYAEHSYFIQDFDRSWQRQVQLEPSGRCSGLNWSSAPVWSDDGKKVAIAVDGQIWIAYFTNRTFGDFGSITLAKLEPNKRSGGTSSAPLHLDWSPDGNRLAFSLGDEIHVIAADGTGQLALTQAERNAVRDSYPSWSPDGRHIAFQRGHCLYDVGPQRWTAEHNGVPLACETEIYVMKADGTELRQVTNNDIWDGHPDWSVAQ